MSLSLHSWTVSNTQFSMGFSFVLFALYSLWIRAKKKNFQTPPNLWSSLLGNRRDYQYKGQCLFSQGSLVVWGAPGALCIILNVLIFLQTHIGCIRALQLGTYLTESVFTKLKFWGFFCTINFFMTGWESHHFHTTGLCSTRMVNRDNVALKPCL